MQCMECGARVQQLDNDHLLQCCGLTLHEYALRHSLPLDLLVTPEQVNTPPSREGFPAAAGIPDETARGVLRGLDLAGLVRRQDGCRVIPGEVRRLDLLLWDLQQLDGYRFRFFQDYTFDTSGNRVVAGSCLRAPADTGPRGASQQLSLAPPPDFTLALAVCVAHVGELHAGYLFLPVARRTDAGEIRAWLSHHHRVDIRVLACVDAAGGAMLRTRTEEDTRRLFAALREHLMPMPGVWERFHQRTPEVTVSKEVVFDSAHFITDHPAKCSNLHGGRYKLHVKVSGRIDPCTGCVIDYGYLKRVVNLRVVDRFDHHTLNFVAGELAWRSSTEMLCVYIWEQLIDYLPGLVELQLYETEQSWCHYSGPGLAEFQRRGGDSVLRHFSQLDARDSAVRRQLLPAGGQTFSVVA